MSESDFNAAAPEHQKKGGIGAGLVILILLVAAIAAGIFFFKKQHDSIINYAPDGTNLIVYLNVQKINENKVVKAAKELFKDDYAKLEKDAEKEGIILDEVLKSQAAIFLNLKDLNNFSGAGVIAFQEKVADKYFKLIAEKCKDDKKVSAREIEGKPGLEVEKNGYLVEASENMLQLAGKINYDGKDAALLKKTDTAIAKRADVSALIYIVLDYKAFTPPEYIVSLVKEYNAEELVNGLNFVSFSIKEDKNDLESCLGFVYDTKEQAAKAGETLKAFVVLGKKAIAGTAARNQDSAAHQKTKDTLNKMEVKIENNRVVLSFDENMDEVINHMKSNAGSLKKAAGNAGTRIN